MSTFTMKLIVASLAICGPLCQGGDLSGSPKD